MLRQGHKNNLAVRGLLISCGLCCSMMSHATDTVTIYAAASLNNAITEIGQHYEQQGLNKVQLKTSYAGSATLAKQIQAGAPADLFISADEQWMDYLQNKKILVAANRVNLLANRLVLISPKNQPVQIKMDQNFDLSRAFKGRLCTGNTQSVPVGRYAKQALTSMGWWNSLKLRLVETEDVRAALNFVARGECPLGIVYATDAAISSKVTIAGVFPESSHAAIIYPLALIDKKPAAMQFYQYLQSNSAKVIFKKYGFAVLANAP